MMNKLNSTIELFCQQGFFSLLRSDTTRIAEKIIDGSKSSYFGNILNLEDESFYEQIVLSYDKEICWFIEDCFGYYLSDEVRPEMYGEVLNQLSRISKGLFVPTNLVIKDCGYCEGRDKRLAINYFFEEKEVELVLCTDGWALILNFLEEVNETILHTDYSFEYIIDPYGPCFIFFLSSKQKKLLVDELNWNFISTPDYWADKAIYFKEMSKKDKAEECFKKAILKGKNINTFVQYGIFLKELNRSADAIEIFEMGKQFIDKQPAPFDNQQWWNEFIDNQIKGINNLKS